MNSVLFVFCAVLVVISAEFSEPYTNSEETSSTYDYSSDQNFGHQISENDEKPNFDGTEYGDNYAGEIKDDTTNSNSNSNFNFPSYTYGQHHSSDTNNYPSNSYGHQIFDSKYNHPSYSYNNYGSGQYFTGQSEHQKFNFPSSGAYGGHDSGILSENIEVTKPVHIPHYKHQEVKIPFSVPVPLPKPVIVKVPQPYPVQILVPHAVPFPVVRTINYTVEKEVPEPMIKEVQFKYDKLVPYEVSIPKKYPVYIPVYKHIYIAKKSKSKPKHFYKKY